MRLTGILAAAAALIATPAVADTTIIHASSVITDASGEASGPATITVTDGKIVSIDDGWLPTPEGATMDHLEGKTVLPGMIESIHLIWTHPESEADRTCRFHDGS